MFFKTAVNKIFVLGNFFNLWMKCEAFFHFIYFCWCLQGQVLFELAGYAMLSSQSSRLPKLPHYDKAAKDIN